MTAVKPRPSEAEEVRAKAFNEGSDARIAGDPFDSCAYKRKTMAWYNWRWGWMDVHRYFGWQLRAGVRERVRAERLAPVRGVA